MSVRAYVEVLGNIGPHRMRDLVQAGLVDTFYVYAGGPLGDYPGNHPQWAECARFVREAGGRVFAWYWCDADQVATVVGIKELDRVLEPDGWLLNIEKPLEGAGLATLIDGVAALGKPIVASLAGTPPQVVYDFRKLDLADVEVEWQAYLDSGEGPPPRVCVTELARCSRVLPGRRYRSAAGGQLGWGEVETPERYASYRTRAKYRIETQLSTRWPPYEIVDRNLYGREWEIKGQLLGHAAYSNIRVALDTTRTAQAQRDLTGWSALAASARLKGAGKRGVAVYLAEVTPDDVFAAIARGAA